MTRSRVPPLLQQVVDGRLARLGETVRDHLAVAAVIGQQVPLNVWQAASGLTEDELLLTIERTVEARLLDAGHDGAQVQFAHALVREALYEGILPPRRRVWHRRVADALVEMPAADPDAVAYHFAQSGDARAADWLVRAGERSQRAYAWLTASDRFAAAVALMEGDDARTRERGWLLYRVGRLLQNAGTIKGIAYLEEAERVALAIDDPVLAAYALFDRGEMTCFLLDADRGLVAMEAGVRAIEALPADHTDADPAVASWVAATLAPTDSAPHRTAAGVSPRTLTSRRGELANWLSIVGRYAEARSVAEQYITEAESVARPDTLTLSGLGAARYALGAVEAAMGRPAEARAAYGRSRATYLEIGHYFMAALVSGTELRFAILPYSPGDIAARQSMAAQFAEDWTRAAGTMSTIQKTHGAVLENLVLEGAWTEAEQVARTLVNSKESIPRTLAYIAGLVLAALARWRGETAEAWAFVGAGLPNGPATTPGGHRIWHAVALQRLAADLALDAGDLPAAVAWLDAHDRWLAWSESVQGRSEARLLWARYHRVAGDVDRARDAAGEALTEATAPRQPLALLATHRLLGEIEIGAERYETAEAHLTEALALAEACAAPFERALTLLAVAELRAESGKTAEAARLLAEVRAVAADLGAAPTLARVDALAFRLAAQPVPPPHGPRLSARELEVLGLVAAGRSNSEIAAALYLSPRTVTTHLTHVFAKIGAQGRADAVAWALRQGLL